ncbi:MAG: acetate--CoA ligase family protein [Arenicella sp.]
MSDSLQTILAPQSIAIVGASRDAAKRGNLAIRYLQENAYQGDIYPIHPREAEILGLACFSSVGDLPKIPDLALICTPAHTLPDIIRDCGQIGIKGAVVLATGFSEIGDAGTALENRMLAAAKETGIRIIGPNTSGIFNAHCGANLVGYRDLHSGSIGLLSQSGNMALSLVTEGTQNAHIGFSTYIGVGNEADIQFHEYLEYFHRDKATQVVVGYIEGLKSGRDFLKSAAQVCSEKPIVIYKSGRTEIGQKTAQSHTGALAGSYAMAKDVMRQAGITLVERADEILPTAETLSLVSPLLPLKSKNVAVLADGGGHAAIAADSLDVAGLQIPNLSEETQKALQEILPEGAAVSNPVDVAGGTDNDPFVFIQCADLLLRDPNIDALLVVGLFGGYALRFNESLLELELLCAQEFPVLIEKTGKPILLQSLYQPMETEPLVNLRSFGVPVFESIDTASRCLASVVNYSEAQHRLRKQSSTPAVATYSNQTNTLISHALLDQRNCLYEYEALEALKEYEADIVEPYIVRNHTELSTFIKQLENDALSDENIAKQRWVMKIVSKDILHKTDAGGVSLNVKNSALETSYHQILSNAKQYDANADIHGVLITPMASGSGVEVIIGVTNDKQYGPVMMFGLGGIFVEVLKDVVFRSLPITPVDAREMLSEIAGSKILTGVRGRPGVNLNALEQLMVSVSSLCIHHPEIEELDLNPVLAREEDYCVLDARIILKQVDQGCSSKVMPLQQMTRKENYA